MANSGTLYSNGNLVTTNLSARLDWWIDNIDNAAGTGTLHYKLYLDGNDTYDTKVNTTGEYNFCQIDGSDIYRLNWTGSGAKGDPYICYVKQSRDNRTPSYASGDWEFTGWFVKWGVLAEGSRTIYYNDDGYASFRVYGAFHCYYYASDNNLSQRVWINEVVSPDRIERFNKAYGTGNSGSSWGRDKYVWKTTDYGATWKKCNVYKTTNSGSSWSKIT
jgi:hypothetical protein